MYTGVHSGVSEENYSFRFFDIPLDVPLGIGNKPGDTWLMYPCGF